MDNIWLPLITGLTSGGFSCFAVQGGLLTSALAQQGTGDVKYQKEKSLLMFIAAKLFAYSVLGALLGAIGSALFISPVFQGWLQLFVGLYMLATAANMLNLHPLFKYVVIQPPKALMKLARDGSRTKTFFAPALLGMLTVIIPCGITQAMMLLAIASGSAFYGASIMFFFILGTSPIFFLIGLAATSLLKNKTFAIIASLFIVFLAFNAINSGQNLRGSVHTFQNYWQALTGTKSVEAKTGNEVNIRVYGTGYDADVNTLKVGKPVRIKLKTENTRGCARAFTIPAYNIIKVLPETGETIIEFTPTKTGRLTYTCSMGMYSGSFNVVP